MFYIFLPAIYILISSFTNHLPTGIHDVHKLWDMLRTRMLDCCWFFKMRFLIYCKLVRSHKICQNNYSNGCMAGYGPVKLFKHPRHCQYFTICYFNEVVVIDPIHCNILFLHGQFLKINLSLSSFSLCQEKWALLVLGNGDDVSEERCVGLSFLIVHFS